jgi:hypothetical protein
MRSYRKTLFSQLLEDIKRRERDIWQETANKILRKTGEF